MQISARCEYACGAVLELALNVGKSVQAEKISKAQTIPKKYLTQILIQLRKAGIVESMRGKEGGYVLAKEPSKITIGEIIRLIDGPIVSCARMATGRCRGKKKKPQCIFKSIWEKTGEAATDIADSFNFKVLTDSAKSLKALEYQI